MSVSRPRTTRVLCGLGAAGLLLSACGGGGGGGTGSGSDGSFDYLGQTENTTIAATFKSLSTDECKTQNDALPLKTSSSPGGQFDQKLQLLSGQGALSDVSMGAGTPALMKQFIEAKQVQDLEPALQEAGAADAVLPAAKATLKALYGDQGLYALPTEFNIEGFWYNEEIFAENGVEIPATWDDFVAAVQKLQAAGVQPIAADGKTGWQITRLIGNYIARDLGPDALQKVADGQAKLDDPEYVKAAEAVAALGKTDAFGKSPGSIDYNVAMNAFLTGKAAMMYNGSWALGNYNDETLNKIGVDNIGYLPFPAVTGGAGSVEDVPANVGVPIMFSSSDFEGGVKDWATCIAQNYGDEALAAEGVVSGFTIKQSPADLPPLTKVVQETSAEASNTILWFEALFSSKATTMSQQNAAPLATGQLSPADFMTKVQNAG